MRKRMWMILMYAPTGLLLANAGWYAYAGEWVAAAVSLTSGLITLIATRNVVSHYRSGYWRGRADLYAEKAMLLPPRDPGDEPSPWDDYTRLDDAIRRILDEHKQSSTGEAE